MNSDLVVAIVTGLLGLASGAFVAWVTAVLKFRKDLEAEYDKDLRERRLGVYRAIVELALGKRGDALNSLEEAYATRSGNLLFMIGPAPFLDALRDEPRFRALRARVGFPR